MLIAAGRSRRGRLVAVGASVVLGGVLLALAIRHFAVGSWPLTHGSPYLIVASGFLFLLAYALKALGWQRLFPSAERPDSMALAAAGGAAALAGIALPGRFDEVVRIAIVRRYRSCPAGVRRLCLSLVVLALIDAAALVPLALAGAAFSGGSVGLRSGLVVVAAVGVVAAALVAALPRLAVAKQFLRFRLGRWLSVRTTPWRRASEAWALVLGSWLARSLALFVLLAALGFGLDFPRAVILLCAGAAAAVLPIGPAGAATQVGASTAIFLASGVGAARALDFAASAQILTVLVGTVVLLAAALRHTGARLASSRRARLA